jgi:hypothetical protein
MGSVYSHIPSLLEIIYDNGSTGQEHTSRKLGNGTGFIYKKNGTHYLITNWHIVSGHDFFTKKNLSKNAIHYPNLIIFRPGILTDYFGVPKTGKPNLSGFLQDSISVPLYVNDLATWYIHPSKQVDVVAIPIKDESVNQLYESYNNFFSAQDFMSADGSPLGFDVKELLKGFFALRIGKVKDVVSINDVKPDNFPIEIADEVFVLGFPFGHTASKSGRQTPIWKKGTIATEPEENYYDDNTFGKTFLIDGITHEGMSGSPVIACKRSSMINGTFPNYTHLSNAYAFIGVYSAHMNFDKDKKENTYLGLVWSKELIDEIIDNHKLGSFI